jgi:magnesium transporter
MKQVGEMLSIQPFIIGDVLNTTRRSRMEELDGVLFFSINQFYQIMIMIWLV